MTKVKGRSNGRAVGEVGGQAGVSVTGVTHNPAGIAMPSPGWGGSERIAQQRRVLSAHGRLQAFAAATPLGRVWAGGRAVHSTKQGHRTRAFRAV